MLIPMIMTLLKVMTLHVILIMSSKIILDLKLPSETGTCYMWNTQCMMQDGLTKVLMDHQMLVILFQWYLLSFSLEKIGLLLFSVNDKNWLMKDAKTFQTTLMP